MIHELPYDMQRGKWIVRAETFGRRTLYYYTCPLCGITKHERTNYCPNCGTELRGKWERKWNSDAGIYYFESREDEDE